MAAIKLGQMRLQENRQLGPAWQIGSREQTGKMGHNDQ